MEQGMPSYTPFSKRSAAANVLIKVLQHVASTNEPNTIDFVFLKWGDIAVASVLLIEGGSCKVEVGI